MNFIELFNEVVYRTRSIPEDIVRATSMDDAISDLNLDSLDVLLAWSEFAIIFGVDEPDQMPATTVGELWAYIQEHQTNMPESVEAALEMI